MNELNSLTLNGKKYESFPDAEVRQGYVNGVSVHYTLSASKNEDVTTEGHEWTTTVPSVTGSKPYLWMRVSYVIRKKNAAGSPSMITVERFAGNPVIVGSFGESISEETLKQAVREYLEENPPAQFNINEDTLSYEKGVLSVKVAEQPIKDDVRPITSGAVYEEFSKAVALLKTI